MIESELFKTFNPKQKEILKKYPTLYGHLTGLDSILHKEEIFKSAIEKKYNILMALATSAQNKDFSFYLNEPLKSGYEIEINIIAVSNINSLLSIHERYEKQLNENYNSPKLSDLSRAINSFEATKPSLEYLINLPYIKINIWKRNTFNFRTPTPPIFLTNDKNLVLETYQNAVIQDEIKTISNADERIEKIYQSMKNRTAPKEQFEQFEKVKQTIQKTKLNHKMTKDQQ